MENKQKDMWTETINWLNDQEKKETDPEKKRILKAKYRAEIKKWHESLPDSVWIKNENSGKVESILWLFEEKKKTAPDSEQYKILSCKIKEALTELGMGKSIGFGLI